MNSKEVVIQGATILVLQDGEKVKFYMNYKTSDYFFCVSYKDKIEDLDEYDFLDIWKQYFDSTIDEENALISYHQAMMEAMEKQQKPKKKKKRPNSGGSEQG